MKKIVFWIIGSGCTGKSYYAEKLSKKLDAHLVHLDCVRDYDSKEAGYRALLTTDENIVMDGIIPVNSKADLKLVKKYIGDCKLIYIILNPEYEQLKNNVEKRRKAHPETRTSLYTEREYKSHTDKLKKFADKYFEVKGEEDFDKLSMEDIRSMNYQKDVHTRNKWDSLKIDCKDKSVLDLGCSSCFFETYANEQGAKSYAGLDVNMAYLFNDNARYFDLNKMETLKEEYDIVVSTSMIHYINDKEKFIKECARITKEVFVLELPLSLLSGLVMEYDPKRANLFFTSKELTESWLSKYFKRFEYIGLSPTEDNSHRVVYHCYV